MPASIRGVEGGTPIDGPILCRTCRRGVELSNGAKDAIYCNYIGRYVPFKVMSCTGYDDVSKPTIYEMEQIAWMLVTDKKGKRVGFVKPDERYKGDSIEQPPFSI